MSLFQAAFRTYIGLDIGAAWIRAAQLRLVRNQWRIEALASIPRREMDAPLSSAEAASVHHILDRQGFAGNRVVVGAPRESTLTGVLDLPPIDSGAPLDQIARMELARVHHVRPTEMEMTYWHVPGPQRGKDSSQVFAVGMRHQDANDLLDCFAGAGLQVKAIDAHTVAMARACRPMLQGGPDVVAVLDTGWRHGWLSILCCGMVIYERCLPSAGLKHLAEAVQVRLGIDLPTAAEMLVRPLKTQADENDPFTEPLKAVVTSHLASLVSEIEAPFSYVRHQNPDAHVGRLILLGVHDCLGLADGLSAAIGIDVTSVRPADLAVCPAHTANRAEDTGLTLAVALAQFSDRRAA